MRRLVKGRPAPRKALAPTAPTVPSGFGFHTVCSDSRSPVLVELQLPFAADNDPIVHVRFFVGRVLGSDHGAQGWESVDLPVEYLEQIAVDLLECVKLAKHHKLLPAE